MSAKLDQSLDDLTKGKGHRASHPRRVRPRRATATPAGGVAKNSKAVKATAKAAATLAAKAAIAPSLSSKGGVKVIVSNLPLDVQENDIKKYFQDTCGPIRNVSLAYGPNGKSRGLVTIVFTNPTAAQKAVALNKTKVDNKPMKIELVLDASTVAAAPVPKGLSDRIATSVTKKQTAGKDKPKSAASGGNGPKSATAGAKKGAAGKGKRPAGRPKKKTAEELDAEMTDYFGNDQAPNGAAANGAAPAGADSMEVS